ncbi:MAG TPA: fimbrial assembly protein [Gallionella sp.]|nr:fimbrial assembly protein [Gallionella sp.]
MSQQINLFNPVFMKQRKYFSLLTMLQALGMIVAGSLCFYAYAVYQVGQLGKQVRESTARYNAEQARLVRFSAEFSPQQAGQLLQDEIKRLEKQASEQSELIETLKSGAVGNTSGYSEYMRAFARQAVPGLWLTGFTVIGDAAQIRLTGRTLSPELLPVYIQRLGKESIMRGKTFAALQMQQPKAEGRANAVPVPTPHYVEFVLNSSPDSEAKK